MSADFDQVRSLGQQADTGVPLELETGMIEPNITSEIVVIFDDGPTVPFDPALLLSTGSASAPDNWDANVAAARRYHREVRRRSHGTD